MWLSVDLSCIALTSTVMLWMSLRLLIMKLVKFLFAKLFVVRCDPPLEAMSQTEHPRGARGYFPWQILTSGCLERFVHPSLKLFGNTMIGHPTFTKFSFFCGFSGKQ